MEGKWAPGKWTAEEQLVSSNTGVGDIVCMAPEFLASREHWPANARLIAAAPELVEALQEAVELLDYYWGRQESPLGNALAKARAALEKAGAVEAARIVKGAGQ